MDMELSGFSSDAYKTSEFNFKEYNLKEPEEVPKETQCNVCLANIDQEEKNALVTSCTHFFHSACIEPWIKDHEECPNCRKILYERKIQQIQDIPPNLSEFATSSNPYPFIASAIAVSSLAGVALGKFKEGDTSNAMFYTTLSSVAGFMGAYMLKLLDEIDGNAALVGQRNFAQQWLANSQKAGTIIGGIIGGGGVILGSSLKLTMLASAIAGFGGGAFVGVVATANARFFLDNHTNS